jgi:hypothetical protein
VLARSELCVQGFSAAGVQFHPEVRLDQIRHWLAQDRRHRQLSDVDGGIDQSSTPSSDSNRKPPPRPPYLYKYKAFFGA